MLSQVVVYLILVNSISSLKKRELELSFRQPIKPKILLNFLHKYDKFNVVIHIDNTTKYDINQMLEYQDKVDPSLVTIYNHETNTEILTRPFASKCVVNLVILQDSTTIIKYLKYKRNIMKSDVIIFMVSRLNLRNFSKKYWFLPKLERAGNVLVICFGRNSLEVYNVCFYCGINSGQLTFQQKLTSDQTYLRPQALYPRRFRNFLGHALKIAYINYFPFVFCASHVKPTKFCPDVIGLEVEVLKILSEKMNFTYELIEIESESYEKLFEKLTTGEFDFALGGLSMTPERLDIVDFSNVFRIEDIILTYVFKPSLLNVLVTIIMPFPPLIWFGIVGTLLVVVTTIYLVSKLYKKQQLPFKYLINIFPRSLVEQPIKLRTVFYKIKITLLVILFSWFFFCLMISATYKSRLTAFLVKPFFRHNTRLEDLIKEDYDIVVDYTSGKTFSEIFSDIELKNINASGLLISKMPLCDSLEYIKTHKTVVIDEMPRLFIHAPLLCYNRTWMHFSYMRTPIGRTMHAWPFKAGTPFVESINKNLERISDSGLMMALNQNLSPFKGRPEFHWRKNRKPIFDFRVFLVYLTVYGICISFAFLVFIAEILIDYLKSRLLKQQC